MLRLAVSNVNVI